MYDPEALQRSLLRLIQELIPDVSLADLETFRQQLEQEGTQPSSSVFSSSPDSESLIQGRSFIDSGVPAVYDRYFSLLKHRLETEIQQKPPLFPWETELQDYEDIAVPAKIPALLGLAQIKALNLPVPLPESVLALLFQRCQEVAQASLLEGAKLVRAVEELFPDADPMLNHLAGLVMTAPARSSATAIPATDASYPSSYDAAAPAQQMLLSLLAAREMLGALTLMVSDRQPTITRQWLTELGPLTLEVQLVAPVLRVTATLPCAGSLTLEATIAQALAAGRLNVEAAARSGVHLLEVNLAGQPLRFALQVEA